jgi:hypothetical protein
MATASEIDDEILDGSSAPCDQKKMCTSYAHYSTSVKSRTEGAGTAPSGNAPPLVHAGVTQHSFQTANHHLGYLLSNGTDEKYKPLQIFQKPFVHHTCRLKHGHVCSATSSVQFKEVELFAYRICKRSLYAIFRLYSRDIPNAFDIGSS